MSRAVLFCNGEIVDYEYHKSILKDDDFIIAVDGGGNHCHHMGIIPALAIGDFDSVSSDVRSMYAERNVESIPFPSDKDYIDMVLGIEEAQKRGYTEIILLGALGGKRADMFLGNALALSAFDENVIMKNEWTEIRFLKAPRSLNLASDVGDYLSVLSLSDEVIMGKSRGLKYPLDGLKFRRGETRSISNEFTENTCNLKIDRGEALIIIQKR